VREFFKHTRFANETMALLEIAGGILAEYGREGMRLTLRQLFYQLVARGHLENSQRNYKRLGDHLGDARLAGMIDWDAIEDRVRETEWSAHWRSPAEIVEAAAAQYRTDKWEDQPCHVEVMVEKDALSGVLQPACEELDVRFTANRGYSSLSHMYEVGKRIGQMIGRGKEVHILYFGDHDPSGLDMDRDVRDRIEMFSESTIELRRMALTMEQVEEHDPPPNPAKITDSRAAAYIEAWGDESWELDAMEPRLLRALVEDRVAELRDDDLFDAARQREDEMRSKLQQFVDGYEEDDE